MCLCSIFPFMCWIISLSVCLFGMGKFVWDVFFWGNFVELSFFRLIRKILLLKSDTFFVRYWSFIWWCGEEMSCNERKHAKKVRNENHNEQWTVGGSKKERKEWPQKIISIWNLRFGWNKERGKNYGPMIKHRTYATLHYRHNNTLTNSV